MIRLTDEERVLSRERALARSKAWYQAHREEISAELKANPEANRAKTAAWKAKNPERWAEIQARSRTARSTKRSADARRYAHEHPDRVRATKARLRHSTRATCGAPMQLADAERILRARVCWYCGVGIDRAAAKYDPCKATIDHIIPLSKGGTNDPSNLAPACRRCNTRKRTRSVEAFVRLLALGAA